MPGYVGQLEGLRMSVTLATHCHSRDLPRLHAPGALEELIAGHAYPFDEILVIHQRCNGLEYSLPAGHDIRVIDIHDYQYPMILGAFGIPHKDPVLSELTHGWNGPHYYEHHCVNHCKELLEATGDYILFSDADCRIINQPAGESWVNKAIQILEDYPEALIVSPSEGGAEFDRLLSDGTRLTRTVSQQIFIGNRQRLLGMDFFHLQWDGEFDAPYGPFQEFYGLMEGWIFRWMRKHNLYRAVLPQEWRYWHAGWH